MSENVYRICKQWFPGLTHVRLAKKIIIAAAILHNILIMWGDEEPPLADNVKDDDGIDDLVLTE